MSTDRGNEYDDVPAMFAGLRAYPCDDPRSTALRETIVTRCLPLAEHIARRYFGRGEPHDDLVQVARLGLVKAVDRFDVDYGSDFLAFAVPTITGEVRRHFRDTGWAVRVPRHLKDLHVDIAKSVAQLSQVLGRAPSAAEIAADTGVTEADVNDGLLAEHAYQPTSIDAARNGDEPHTLADTLGDVDEGLTEVENQETLRCLLAALAPRERGIVLLRFFANLTQTQIADRVGVSQMQVSRILARSLATMREEIET